VQIFLAESRFVVVIEVIDMAKNKDETAQLRWTNLPDAMRKERLLAEGLPVHYCGHLWSALPISVRDVLVKAL